MYQQAWSLVEVTFQHGRRDAAFSEICIFGQLRQLQWQANNDALPKNVKNGKIEKFQKHNLHAAIGTSATFKVQVPSLQATGCC
jgi:hypothetical protein